jgi:hypothetical protein
VLVLVPLGEVEQDAHTHEHRRDHERNGDRVTERHRQNRPEEGRHAVVSTGASSPHVTHGDDKEDERDTVGQQPDSHRRRNAQHGRQRGPQREGEHEVADG